ncbi:MAG: RMD1 family protein [Rhodospirillales bacterium]
MIEARLSAWTRVGIHALLVGDRLDLRGLQKMDRRAETPLLVAAGERGVAVLFRYGAAIMFGVQPVEEIAFLDNLRSALDNPHEVPESEESEIRVASEGTERIDVSGCIHLKRVTEAHLQVIADVLAKSVVLAYYEERVARVFDRIEPVARRLRRTGRGPASVGNLLDLIGDVLLTQQRMVGRVEVVEKPDVLWDRPDLERLHLRLAEEYELPDRDRALGRKLDLIAQTATTSLGLLNAKRSLRVEWYIVILIMVEIVIYLVDLLYLGGGH